MALDKQVIEDHKKAGAIIVECIDYGKTLIKPGADILEVCKKIEMKIKDLGGKVAFPAQISIDKVAAHWCPEPDDEKKFEEGQLVKLDIGCHINGRIADTAISIDLSKEGKHEKLIKAAEDARDAALKIMKPGTTLGEIGKVIQETIQEAGFTPIHNLSGHGLDEYEVHTTPSVPNIDSGDRTPLEAGMVLAVEPFATTGQGHVYEQDQGNIYALIADRPVRNVYARKAMKIIRRQNGLPFSLHQLAGAIGTGQAKLAMRELVRSEAVEIYPPLVEQGGGIVSQAEHSVIITEDEPIVFTRK